MTIATVSVNGGPEVPLDDVVDRLGEARFGNVSADRLRSIVERIERMEEERKAIGGDIKDIYLESKSSGFDVKVIRQLIRIRKMEPGDVEEQETLLDVYRSALDGVTA